MISDPYQIQIPDDEYNWVGGSQLEVKRLLPASSNTTTAAVEGKTDEEGDVESNQNAESIELDEFLGHPYAIELGYIWLPFQKVISGNTSYVLFHEGVFINEEGNRIG